MAKGKSTTHGLRNMAPKVHEKQHTQQQQSKQQPLNNNSIVVKHSSLFHISAFTLCHNKRLKLKRSKNVEYLRNAYRNNRSTPQHQRQKQDHKTEFRRQKLSLLQADVTIDLLSDDEDNGEVGSGKKNETKQSIYPERMCLERAAILGLMPVDRSKIPAPPPPPLVPLITANHHHQTPNTSTTHPQVFVQQKQTQPLLMVPIRKLTLPQTQPRKRKSRPQKRCSLPVLPKTPILIDNELIVLSDESNEGVTVMRPPSQPILRHQTPELSVTCPTSSQIPCLPQQNTMQVDEEVTISLVPRSLTATTCASRSSLQASNTSPSQEVFPMLPDETTVHTVIANRIYELSLTKLREGLASCGIPEFADGQQKISPQRRKGMVHQPPMVSPPQAPISLKLSSDLSISLISDDEDEIRQRDHNHEPILSPAFLQKLPVNVSIAPVPMGPPTNHTTELRKLKLG